MRKLFAMVLCLAMVLTLVACATEDKDKNNTDLPTDNQPNTAPNNNGDTAMPGGDVTDDKNGNTVSPGSDTVLPNDNAKSKSRNRTVTDPYDPYDDADGMATWRQMLDNGRVRDTDGFLADGENASWS